MGHDNTRTTTQGFYCISGRQSGYWTTSQVPSRWGQQGFGARSYGRDCKTYGKNFRFADAQGKHKPTFSVPAGRQNQAVYPVFGGATTNAEVRMNGQPVSPVH